MNETLLAVTMIAYSAAVISTLYYLSGHALVKTAAVIGLFMMVWLVFASTEFFKGWPTPQPISDSSYVISVNVEEPSSKSDGAIYVMAIPPGESLPRLYVLPYTPNSAEKAMGAGNARGHGANVVANVDDGGTVTYEVVSPELPKK